ncbi:hypothetical protein, partial [Streptomyces sp. NPDC127040]|uniref:hypothetical protein n=1 Tax=Streptomyces sp. NPDC127040 TaxID=3347116 RepID=UPI0036561D09
MTTPKPGAGQIWQNQLTGQHVLVAHADQGHAVTCPVKLRADGHPVSHPRGQKAERVLTSWFGTGKA